MEVPRPSRTCSVSQRDFHPNEPFFSVLTDNDGFFIRNDIAAEHWTEPPKHYVGWWKTTAKHIAERPTQRQCSGETLQDLFEHIHSQQGDADTLYVLTLLMIRRRMLRLENETADEHGNRQLEVYSLNTNLTYQIPVAIPNQERLEAIQQLIDRFSSL